MLSSTSPRLVSLAAAALLVVPGLSMLHARAEQDAAPARQSSGALDPQVLAGLQWRSIGPDRGGRSIAVSGVKGRPKEAYFGAAGGGLWKTLDAGTTWAAVTDGQIHSSSVGAVAVSESNPDIVFIGMGEACIRGNILPGDGVYKSTDAGKTWTHLGFTDSQAIAKIRIHPTNPDVVFVASFGRYGAPSDERGVFKSADGGTTWRKVLFRDDRTGAVDIAIDRRHPAVMFAAMWEAYRVEYQMSSGGPGSGLFKSTDGGDSWTEITRNPGLPAGVVGKIGVSVSGADSTRIYALVENEHGGLFVSDDGGATWRLGNGNRSIRQRAFYYTHVTADPKDKDTVYLLNTSAFRSTDAGKTLTSIGGGTHGDHHDLWVDPDDPTHIVLGNDGGGTVTVDNAKTWSEEDYPTAQYYHVVATRHVPYHVCGAQQDGSTVCLPSDAGTGRGRGNAAANSYSPGGAEPAYIAPDPTNVNRFFSGGNNGSFLIRLDRDSGEVREVSPYPRMFSGEPSSALVERWQWTYPIIFSAADPKVLFTSSQHVWKTTDGGQTWSRISPDLTRHDPQTMGDSGGPITHDMNAPEVYATVFALGPGKTDVDVLWAGSDDGLVNVTQDGGKTWADVTPKEMPAFGRVSQIDASSFAPGGAYIAVKKPLLDDVAPYAWRTRDFGRTWTKIVAGIAEGDYVHVVREDPTRRGLLYAGTEHGAYVSFDDGDHWTPFSLNLPDTQVSDLIVEGNSLAIATHGRGFYILDDLAPIRQSGAATPAPSADFQLYAPARAVRSGAPASISYRLKKPAQALTLDILDGSGTVIRSYKGGVQGRGRGTARAPAGTAPPGQRATPQRGAAAAAADSDDEDEQSAGGRGRAGAPTVPMTAGLHRVTWDLNYAGPTTFPGMVLWGATTSGPSAPPGRYQVRLAVDGRSEMQPIDVVRHPLKTATDADLQAQFELALRIRDKVSEANHAVIRIRQVKDGVQARLGKSPDARLEAAAGLLTRGLSAIEEEIYQVRNQSNQDPLNFPIKINNRLASLLRAVNTGDGRPTSSIAPIFTDLTAELKVQTDRLQEVLSTALPAFNTEARRAGLDPIDAK